MERLTEIVPDGDDFHEGTFTFVEQSIFTPESDIAEILLYNNALKEDFRAFGFVKTTFRTPYPIAVDKGVVEERLCDFMEMLDDAFGDNSSDNFSYTLTRKATAACWLATVYYEYPDIKEFSWEDVEDGERYTFTFFNGECISGTLHFDAEPETT